MTGVNYSYKFLCLLYIQIFIVPIVKIFLHLPAWSVNPTYIGQMISFFKEVLLKFKT